MIGLQVAARTPHSQHGLMLQTIDCSRVLQFMRVLKRPVESIEQINISSAKLSFIIVKYLFTLSWIVEIVMPKILHLLKPPEKRNSQEEKLQVKCSRCDKRLATDEDGFCSQCRFDVVLSQIALKK